MPNPPLEDATIKERIGIWNENARNTSAAARLIGINRTTMQHTIHEAVRRGMIGEEALRESERPARAAYVEARTRKIAAFQRKKRKGDWRKPVALNLPERPFRLKLFGDPHLDADGCDFELFEKHWLEMDAAEGVYGVCIGDFFNNWLKALAHLWREESTHPSDAWLCLEYLMEERGDALLAACSGNHDDWTHGPADPVDMLMKKHGVLYRQGAIRLMAQCGELEPMFWSLRHKWKGYSMYSAAHGMVRASRDGWRDSLMVGGHIHQDEPRLLTFPDGFKAHVCQVSSFKCYDTYADVHGLVERKISPCWDLVIDPRLPESDPDKIKVFWDSERAASYLRSIE